MDIFAPVWSRRRFLRALGSGALLSALPAALRAEQPELLTISLLHTTDLHGHILPTTDYAGHPDLGGFARCATQLRQWRAAQPHSLLFDVGDVYQGTEVSLESHGALMIRLLNALQYDAWVIGNHEFDFGPEALAQAVQLSRMPVLSANSEIAGQRAGARGAGESFANLRPYLLKEIAGIRIAIIGLTTPGLPYWIPPENRGVFEVLDPVEALRPLLGEVAALRPDAIVLAGHMGLTRLDDYANRVGALTREFPQIKVYLGGHTHQNHPGEKLNGVLYTQADHFGIYAGKVDLTFDRSSRRLVQSEATTVLMDHQIPFDPQVMSLAGSALTQADHVLAQPVGRLTKTFAPGVAFDQPGEMERLIGSAIVAALQGIGVKADVVIHGLFDEKMPFLAGPKTVGDCWTLLPYENEIVTMEVASDDLLAMAVELGASRERRALMGVRVVGSAQRNSFVVTKLVARDGSPLPSRPFYRVAVNAYDAQSGGNRFPVLARLAAQSNSHRTFHPILTRDALINFFTTRREISEASLLV